MNNQKIKPNPDLAKERKNGTVEVEKLKNFIGRLLFGTTERYKFMVDMREKIINEIGGLDYNIYHLERNERYNYSVQKTIQCVEFNEKNNIIHPYEKSYLVCPIMGTSRHLLLLHGSMVRIAAEVLGTEEQKQFWVPKLDKYEIIATYAQTELGHGTYVKGLETEVTFDKQTDEFIINSPTITSYKYWPGSLGVTCNSALIMAKLILDGKDYGIHAFMVPIRSPQTHKPYSNIEVGDIGCKYGFNAQDNGFLAFHNYRIPRFYMLMKNAQVSREGAFTRSGNELLLYSSMLLTRSYLSVVGSQFLAMALTIAIRYSCVRRQTANPEGIEPPVLDYSTQQYRLLSGLATSYALYLSEFSFRTYLRSSQGEGKGINIQNVNKSTLAKLHILSSALKAYTMDNALHYAQVARLCCGGHGYSSSAGLAEIIVEADAGCTYEGDNIVLYLQTARYLLKCAQRNESPHFKFQNEEEILRSNVYLGFKSYVDKYNQLYEQSILEASEKLMYFMSEKKLNEYDAWNSSSALLVNAAKAYINLFVIISNIFGINLYIIENGNDSNAKILINLLELYLLYGLTNTFSLSFLKYGIIDPETARTYQAKLFSLLPVIRKDGVLLVDAFDFHDSNLVSTLGCYDGNVYERLLDYARNSPFNKKDPIEQFEKYLKPFMKSQSKL